MRYAKQTDVHRLSYRLESMDGIDRSSFATDSELQDALNLTSDGRPFWKTRPPRGRWHRLSEIENDTNSGLFVFNRPISGACTLADGLCWTTGEHIYIGGKKIEEVTLTETERKQLLPMGRDLFIVPDGVFLHKNEDGVWAQKYANERAVVFADGLRYGSCLADATDQKTCIASASAPESPADEQDWLDTSVSPAVLKAYSEADGWTAFEPDAWFFEIRYLQNTYKIGDVVDIRVAGQIRIRGAVITSVSDRQVVVQGTVVPDYEPGNAAEIGKSFPVIDHAVVCGNRVWGCRYGENQYGEFVNEIFCSALGDPLTWYRYGTGADDSYCASLGITGDFTGAGVLYDDVVFFKENAVITVSGTEPATYRVTSNEGKGVRKGCEKSIARLGSALVYCGVDGVYRTNGVHTLRLCDGLLPVALENAVGGVIGEKYYLAAHTTEGEKQMYVFTAGRNTYHREDNNYDVQFFVPQRNCLYMICMPTVTAVAGVELHWIVLMLTDCNAPGKSTNCLLEEGRTEADYGYAAETDMRWFALTQDIDCGTDRTKILREINVRFALGENAVVNMELRTDRGEVRKLASFTGAGIRRRTIHVRCKPCEVFRLYFSGFGECTIRETEIVYEIAKGEESHV